MAQPRLRGLRVLLTRPHPHNDRLQALLTAAGAEVRVLPMLAIEPVPESPALRQRLMNLDLYQVVIAISPNAARFGLELIDRYWPQLPVGIDWFAVGQGSAAVLTQHGIVAQVPEGGHDSEAMLRLPRLRQVAGERVLILRGEGGRELLANALTERGALVEHAELYRRAAPELGRPELEQALLSFDPHVTLLFSGETSDHLLRLCREHQLDLSERQLWLSSQRALENAQGQGCRQLRVMSALDEGFLVQALDEWHHRSK